MNLKELHECVVTSLWSCNCVLESIEEHNVGQNFPDVYLKAMVDYTRAACYLETFGKPFEVASPSAIKAKNRKFASHHELAVAFASDAHFLVHSCTGITWPWPSDKTPIDEADSLTFPRDEIVGHLSSLNIGNYRRMLDPRSIEVDLKVELMSAVEQVVLPSVERIYMEIVSNHGCDLSVLDIAALIDDLNEERAIQAKGKRRIEIPSGETKVKNARKALRERGFLSGNNSITPIGTRWISANHSQ